MKRKMWAAALAASMVMSAFSGMTVSAAEADSDLSGTLTILSWYDETKAAPVLEAFKEKYPNVNVDFQYSPPVQDYVEKLSTLLYSGAGPDIFYMALENREDLIKGGYCLDLSDESYMTDGTIPDSVKTTYGKDGKAYALAVDCWVGGILVNRICLNRLELKVIQLHGMNFWKIVRNCRMQELLQLWITVRMQQ